MRWTRASSAANWSLLATFWRRSAWRWSFLEPWLLSSRRTLLVAWLMSCRRAPRSTNCWSTLEPEVSPRGCWAVPCPWAATGCCCCCWLEEEPPGAD